MEFWLTLPQLLAIAWIFNDIKFNYRLRTVQCHQPVEQQHLFPAGCKFLSELVHMIGISNIKKTF